jgi:hypothetical protein
MAEEGIIVSVVMGLNPAQDMDVSFNHSLIILLIISNLSFVSSVIWSLAQTESNHMVNRWKLYGNKRP